MGEVDFLQLIENWRQLLQFQVGEKQLEAQLRQSVASLARAVGGYHIPEGVTEVAVPSEPVPGSSAIQHEGVQEFKVLTNSVDTFNEMEPT